MVVRRLLFFRGKCSGGNHLLRFALPGTAKSHEDSYLPCLGPIGAPIRLENNNLRTTMDSLNCFRAAKGETRGL